MSEETIVDPESGNEVRFTDNGLKDGDLPGIDPSNGYFMELVDSVRELVGDE